MKPLVSVIMVTYNHEKYIEEAINGVLMQEGDFDVELFVANDKSPDNTAEIVEHIKREHPKGNWIVHLNREKNLGMMGNFLDVLNRCKGKYIAMCDGDDFWIDSRKLQSQIEFLESNSAYVACYHDVEIRNESGREMHGKLLSEFIDNATTEDILKKHFIPTPSLVFRSVLTYPDWFTECPSGDIPLELLLSLKGKFKFLNEKLAVKRYTGFGEASSGKKHLKPETIFQLVWMYAQFNRYSNYTFDVLIYRKNFRLIRDFITPLKLRWKAIAFLKPFNYLKFKEIVSMLLFPKLYQLIKG